MRKPPVYTEEQNQISVFAKAFGHPARVAIIQHLFKVKECICGDLVKEIGLAQPTISQHLKELRNLGLIKGTIEGPRVCYCIDPDHWTKMKAMMMDFLNQDLPETTCC